MIKIKIVDEDGKGAELQVSSFGFHEETAQVKTLITNKLEDFGYYTESAIWVYPDSKEVE